MLANRPGRKFHGNNLHASIGDCFRTHVIPNPDLTSEIELLKLYAPSVPQSNIVALAEAFADLRTLFHTGDINYPYSTREAVAVAKHLKQYPLDGIVRAVSNVVDVDTFDDETYKKIITVFKKRGVKLQVTNKDMVKANHKIMINYIDGKGEKHSSPPPMSSPKVGKTPLMVVERLTNFGREI